MIFQTRDFRQILSEVLLTRQTRNARYSLRAFARDLKMSPSRLSEVMSGGQGMSPLTATAIAPLLGLNDLEQEFFAALVAKTCSKNASVRDRADIVLKKISGDFERQELRQDTFVLISKWYYFAILELLKVKSLVPTFANIAKSLSITQQEAKGAIQRLLQLEFIEKKANRFAVLKPKTVTKRFVPSDAQKNFHGQILDKAGQAIFLQTYQQRSVGSLFFTVDEKDIPEAFKAIEAFRREFSERFGSGSDHVYCLATQMFQINDQLP